MFAANGPMAQGLAAQGPVAQRHTKGPRRPKNGPGRAQRNPEKVQEGTGAQEELREAKGFACLDDNLYYATDHCEP